MIGARISINEYTNRVFGVIKAKYGLKDKSESINKFVELYGYNEIEPEVREDYLKELNKIQKDTLKNGFKPMTRKELDELFK